MKPKWAKPQASLLTKPSHSPQGELILEFIVRVAVLIKSEALLAIFQAQETVRHLRISERPELHSQGEKPYFTTFLLQSQKATGKHSHSETYRKRVVSIRAWDIDHYSHMTKELTVTLSHLRYKMSCLLWPGQGHCHGDTGRFGLVIFFRWSCIPLHQKSLKQ